MRRMNGIEIRINGKQGVRDQRTYHELKLGGTRGGRGFDETQGKKLISVRYVIARTRAESAADIATRSRCGRGAR